MRVRCCSLLTILSSAIDTFSRAKLTAARRRKDMGYDPERRAQMKIARERAVDTINPTRFRGAGPLLIPFFARLRPLQSAVARQSFRRHHVSNTEWTFEF